MTDLRRKVVSSKNLRAKGLPFVEYETHETYPKKVGIYLRVHDFLFYSGSGRNKLYQ
jgi:hypothetical protein